MKSTWKITGYDGVEPFYESEAAVSEARICEIVRLLAARHLSDDEIVGAMTTPGNLLLEVQRNEGGVYGYTCGENPHYTVTLLR